MKILVIEDYWVTRAGLRYVLEQLERQVEVLEAGRWEDAKTAAAANPDLDLVILDIMTVGVLGLKGLSALRQSLPETPVVVFSAIDDRREILATIDRGAVGFIPKTATGEEILRGLKHVLSGAIYLPRALIERVAQREAPSAEKRPALAPRPDVAAVLTDRQYQVFEYLGEGKSNDEIAAELGLSKHTVRIHVTTICAKLGARNRFEAVSIAGAHLAGALGC